jgi:hypothetical protein
MFLGFFYKEIFSGFIRVRVIVSLILMYVLFSIINILFLQSLLEYPSLPASICKITYLLASIIFFHKIMLEAKITSLWSEPLIWINFAILIYYAGGLSFSLILNLALLQSMEFAKLISRSFYALNIIFYLLITVGFLKAVKQKNSFRNQNPKNSLSHFSEYSI